MELSICEVESKFLNPPPPSFKKEGISSSFLPLKMEGISILFLPLKRGSFQFVPPDEKEGVTD